MKRFLWTALAGAAMAFLASCSPNMIGSGDSRRSLNIGRWLPKDADYNLLIVQKKDGVYRSQ